MVPPLPVGMTSGDSAGLKLRGSIANVPADVTSQLLLDSCATLCGRLRRIGAPTHA
jgi:hypothetical protein